VDWQDWVFAIGGLLVLVSLVPTIRAEQKPALTTSLMTTVLVFIFASTMVTLGLVLAAVTNYGISAAWGLLAFQGYQQQKRAKHEGMLPQIEDEILHSLPHHDADNNNVHEPELVLSSTTEAHS
jgi:hypothetical protein